MKEIEFKGFNDYELNVAIWDEVQEPKAVLQIMHGMVEHIARYDDFARYLNANGYIVIGDDHRGHGKTAKGRLGVTPKGDCFRDTVEDAIAIGKWAVEQYNLPLMLFGHSYGSFLSQSYIQKAGKQLKAVILCGSACKNTADVKLGRGVAKMQYSLFGGEKPAKMIKDMSFGPYNAQFKEGKENAWLTRDDSKREEYNSDPMCNYTMCIAFYKSLFGALGKLYKPDAMAAVRKDLPILIISGDCDPVGGNGKLVDRLYNIYKEYGVMDVSIKLYNGARHELINELNKDEVYADVLRFLDAHAGGVKEAE